MVGASMMAAAGELHHSFWNLGLDFSKAIWNYLGFYFFTLSCITPRSLDWRWLYRRLLTFGVGFCWSLAGITSPVALRSPGQLWFTLGSGILLCVLTLIKAGLRPFGWTIKEEITVLTPVGLL